MIERIQEIEKYTDFLPDIALNDPKRKTMARIYPKTFINCYYLLRVDYKDRLLLIKTLANKELLYCYRSISGSGGIFDDNDDYIEVMCTCLPEELEACQTPFDDYRKPDELFFDKYWNQSKSAFIFYSSDTDSLYFATKEEFKLPMLEKNYKLYRIDITDPAPFEIL